MSRAEHLDRLVSPSLVRICNQDGATLGTGFVMGAGGLIMTCHHVIGEHGRVTVHFAEGVTIEVAPRMEDAFAEADLALLRVPGTDHPALPLVPAGDPPAEFWTKGFQFQGRGLTDAVPVDGDIIGSSRISYGLGDHSYALPVLVLSEGDLDEGLSGAPLMDTESGAVYAVVVAHLPNSTDIGGFALALPKAACLWPDIHQLLAINDAACPRFGSRVNALGTEVLCRRQVDQMLDRLKDQRFYLPEMYCERESLVVEVRAFADSCKRVMPIVGEAGVGKTMFLARLAQTLSVDQPLLFLRGLAIVAGQRSVADLVDVTLVDTEPAAWPEFPKASDLAVAIHAAGKELWLLLDALNEHRAASRDFAEIWIPETIAWLKGANVRLVFTCRPELWQLVENRFADNATGKRPEVRLQDFDKDEVRRATEIYDLPELAEVQLARHPLALRLAWDDAKQSGSREDLVSFSTMIDRLIDRICRRVALLVDKGMTFKRLRATIEELAAQLFTSQSQEMTFGAVAEKFGYDAPWLDALIDEHLLLTTQTGYRFAFDEVGEYLQSAQITAAHLADPAALFAGKKAVGVLSGVVAHAYGRLANAGQFEDLRRAVSAFCAWLQMDAAGHTGLYIQYVIHPRIRLGFDIARRLVGKKATENMITDIILACRNVNLELTRSLFIFYVEQLHLPVRKTLDLVRSLLPAESWHGWRRKDWRDAYRRRHAVFRDKDSLSLVVGLALQRDSAATIDALFAWVSDNTKLLGHEFRGSSDSEATIGDFALACLFYGRYAGLREISERMAANATESWALAFLRTLAETNTKAMLDQASLWNDRPDRHQAAAAVLSHCYYKIDSNDGTRQRIVPCSIGFCRRPTNRKFTS